MPFNTIMPHRTEHYELQAAPMLQRAEAHGQNLMWLLAHGLSD